MRFALARFIVVIMTALSGFVPVSFGQKEDWTNFKSENGRYSIDLPGKPKVEEKEKGKRVMLELGEFKPTYIVWYFDLSDDELKGKNTIELLDAKMKEFTFGREKQSGKIVGEEKLILNKFPGRAATTFTKDLKDPKTGKVLVKGCNEWCKERMYMVGSRLYNLRWVCESESEPLAEDADKFFKSFKLAE